MPQVPSPLPSTFSWPHYYWPCPECKEQYMLRHQTGMPATTGLAAFLASAGVGKKEWTKGEGVHLAASGMC